MGYTNLSPCKPTTSSTVKNIFTSIQICMVMSSAIWPWFITNNQGDKHGCDWQAYAGETECLSNTFFHAERVAKDSNDYTLTQFPSNKKPCHNFGIKNMT